MNSYPIHLSDIKTYGIEEWLKENKPNIFCGEYQRIYKAVFNSYRKVFANENHDYSIYYTGIINYKNIPYLSQFLYERICSNKLKEKGFESSWKDKKDFNFDKIDFSLSSFERLKEKWRIVRTNYGYRNLWDSVYPESAGNEYLLLGDRSQKEVREYVKECGAEPVCIRPLLYEKLSSRSPVSREHQKILKDCIETFFELVFDQIPDSKPEIGNSVKKDFESFYQKTLNVLVNTIEVLSEWKLRKLLITHVGNVYHRIFASAWKELGGETLGFSHGNIYPYAYNPGDILNGANDVLNKFIVASEGEKRLLEDAVKDYGGGFGGKTAFATYKDSVYKPIFEILQKDQAVGEISRVMLIGHPMDYFNSPYLTFMNSMTLCHLELRLIKILKEAGYKVIYKAHPDTISEISGLYDCADEIITGRFEENYKECDCILFTKPFSTTFGYALMTNRPVVLLNSPQIKWHKEVFPLLEKRCAIVETEIDCNGSISFDQQNLIDAVKNSKDKLNYEIVWKFAL